MLDLCMFAEGGRYEQEIVLTGDKENLKPLFQARNSYI